MFIMATDYIKGDHVQQPRRVDEGYLRTPPSYLRNEKTLGVSLSLKGVVVHNP